MDVAVVDASVVVDLLTSTEARERFARLLGDGEACAPDVVDLEVLSALRRLVQAGTLEIDVADALVEALVAMPITRTSSAALVERIWALRANLTPYDAAYVALAEAEECPLISNDGRLAGAPGVGVTVVSVAVVT